MHHTLNHNHGDYPCRAFAFRSWSDARPGAVRCGSKGHVLHVVLIILLCATARSLWADDGISIGTLVLDWPKGFSNHRTGDALLLRGPDDEHVVVSYLRGRNDFGRLERARFARMHQVFALRTLPDSAAMRGAVVQALRCTQLPNGMVVYSTASQASQASQPYYYLQYFVVGPFIQCLAIQDRGIR